MKKDKFSRRNFIIKSGISLAGLGVAPSVLRGNLFEKTKALSKKVFGQNRKPNIIVIYTDDQNLLDLGCYGGKILTQQICLQ